ncbi:MAG: hypothetical protein KAT62_03650 [Desulfuromonadales bacterium]|nr:hypothetical protein [Desulfuromonadales bacterium]
MQKWLYHAKHKAQIIETDDVDMDELYEDGWKDRPVAQAAQVEEKQEQSDNDILPPSIELTMDQVNDLVDNGIIEADEGIEIIVTDFVPKQEQPESTDNVQDLNPEAQSGNGDNEAPGATYSLLEQFKEDPYSLNKDEHVILGKSLGIQTMISSWAEKTLIAKIKGQLTNGNNEATD